MTSCVMSSMGRVPAFNHDYWHFPTSRNKDGFIGTKYCCVFPVRISTLLVYSILYHKKHFFLVRLIHLISASTNDFVRKKYLIRRTAEPFHTQASYEVRNEGLPPKRKKKCLKTNRAVTSLACPGVISRLWPDRPLMVVLLIVSV